MKLPAFQFYPGDWRKDAGVQSLSYHDRGVWFEILCLMHESARRGMLLLGGRAMPEEALARLLGLDIQILTTTLTTIVAYGVATRDADTGALVCRRMVRDEKLRQTRQNAGKQGGNPLLLNQIPTTRVKQNRTTRVKQKPTPSSSSSVSSSDTSGPPAKRQRARDVCFDALATATGSDLAQLTRTAAGEIAKALKDIRDVNPNLTADDIARRAARYRSLHPTWPITPSSIAKYWATLDVSQAAPHALPALPEPTDWFNKILRIAGDGSPFGERCRGKAWGDLTNGDRDSIARAIANDEKRAA